jgi:uncharacterized repeat protein (TIGR03803 family)
MRRILSLLMVLTIAFLAMTAEAQTVSLLYTFGLVNGDPLMPAGPAAVAQGHDGNLYATSTAGGNQGWGTVFAITPTGTLKVLYDFDGTHGSSPAGGVTLATDGNFYGATYAGGTSNQGVLFKITPSGTLSVLYNFTGGNDGALPIAPPIQAADGSFYGTTYLGGTQGLGTVFRLTHSGRFTTLFSFDGVHGKYPNAGLVQATDGQFYGTTTQGGTNDNGEVFKITKSGKLTVLHRFDGTDGANPFSPVVEGSDGKLYGTTFYGGSPYGGVVFTISTTGSHFTVLHDFNPTDGIYQQSGLVQGTDNNFYGATPLAGTNNYGTLYRISPKGSFSLLYNFDGSIGSGSDATLLLHTSGVFFGTTFQGGAGEGTFYSLDVGLGPFVSPVPASGHVGTGIGILGQGFKGTTRVLFNRRSAKFSVKSDTYLTAIVPKGATTGFVTVTTPKRKLKSNKKFRVN